MPEPQHGDPDGEVAARACLTAVAAPGNPLMGALLGEYDACEVWEALRSESTLPRLSDPSGEARSGQRAAQWKRWQHRARAIDADALLSDTAELGGRIVVPGSPEWPSQLDTLAGHRPYALWVRGAHDLRNACLRAVSLVGSRAASGYGLHVAGEMAHTLAQRATTTVSGGAYGIDAAAHRGALAAGGATVVVLACGLDVGYPRGHENLFADVAANGTLITEYPLGSRPNRGGFLVRNRVIAALSPGTVIVEAGLRSGAMNTARHAHELHRVLMAVPGPVTSALSAGCHRLLRDWNAVCVTDAAEVAEQLAPIGTELHDGRALPDVDELDPEAQCVLAAVPQRPPAGTSTIAAAAGVGLDVALRHLGLLAAGGFIERGSAGWRRKPSNAKGNGDSLAL